VVSVVTTPPSCRFFEDYKKNENKHVRVDEILGAEEAIKAVKDGLVGVS
jgi:inorganic pyrophosphatase